MSTIPDWLTLVAVLIAAGVVAWLAYEIRRSTKTAETAAATAGEALTLAREEQATSRQLVAEAIKTRIDAQAPTITIVPHDEMRVVNDLDLPVRFPRTDDKPLHIAVGFSVINDGTATVILRRRTFPAAENGAIESDATVLTPGQRTFVPVEVSRPLEEWRAVADAKITGDADDDGFRAAHGFDRDARVIFFCAMAGDDGAADEYPFRLLGSPLTPITGDPQAYHCWGANQVIKRDLRLVADPRRRTYYLSRRRGIELPSPGSFF